MLHLVTRKILINKQQRDTNNIVSSSLEWSTQYISFKELDELNELVATILIIDF